MTCSVSKPASPLHKWALALATLGVISVPCICGQESPLPPVEMPLQGSTTLSGYVDTSVLWAIDTPSGAGGTAPFPNTIRLPGRLYDTAERMNGFNLDAVSLCLTKPLSDESLAAGYHVQLLMGPDVALRSSYSLASGPSDLAVNEAYVTLRAPLGNGLEFRLGYFTSPLGYEVYDRYRDPNFSRSYGYYIEPKAHTGLTAKYAFAEWCSVMGGVANNYSPFVNARPPEDGQFTYLALARFTGAAFDCPAATLTLGYTGGHTATGAPTDTDPLIHNFYAGVQLPLFVEGLALGLAYDYRANYSAGWPAQFFLPAGPKSSYANATGVYLTYKITKWNFCVRTEYAQATAANTIFAARSDFGSSKPMFGPNDEKFLGVTTTVGYELWQNVLSRIEFRWDHDCAGGVPVFGTAASPRADSYTLGLNVIYMF
jgi:hypothetical protein